MKERDWEKYWVKRVQELEKRVYELETILLEVRPILERWNGCGQAPWWKKYMEVIGEGGEQSDVRA